MNKKRRTPIQRPDAMPIQFTFRGREYRWYRNLRRDRKRYMIKLFNLYTKEILSSISKPISSQPEISWICIMVWDERAGPRILGKFPFNFEISPATLMQIYANYLGMNIDGYFQLEHNGEQYGAYQILTEEENRLYIILAAKNIENFDIFKNPMERIANMIISKPFLLFSDDHSDIQLNTMKKIDSIIEIGNISDDFIKTLYNTFQQIILKKK
ncbi:hypothetical protein [Candidatus Harpocratesius sp.]